MGKWIKEHPKVAGLIATVAVAGAAYYGVPPGYTEQALKAACALLGC